MFTFTTKLCRRSIGLSCQLIGFPATSLLTTIAMCNGSVIYCTNDAMMSQWTFTYDME